MINWRIQEQIPSRESGQRNFDYLPHYYLIENMLYMARMRTYLDELHMKIVQVYLFIRQQEQLPKNTNTERLDLVNDLLTERVTSEE